MYIILFCLAICISVWIAFMGDQIVIKTKLKNADICVAEIVDFEEVNFIKGSIFVTIVKYMKNDVEKTAIVYKGKKDKIGNKIVIVTDGNIAARDTFYIKEEMSIGAIIVFIGVVFFLAQRSEEYFTYASIIMLVIVALLAILHPYTYESHNCEIKRKLGWHE